MPIKLDFLVKFECDRSIRI